MSYNWEDFKGVPLGEWVRKRDNGLTHWAHKCSSSQMWIHSGADPNLPKPKTCFRCSRKPSRLKKLKEGFISLLHTRSIKKTISWRIIALVLTIVTALLLTGSMKIASSIGIIDAVLKTFIYWLHEEAWDRYE